MQRVRTSIARMNYNDDISMNYKYDIIYILSVFILYFYIFELHSSAESLPKIPI